MTRIITIIATFLIQFSFAQSASAYLEKIRNNEVKLTAFFQQMPKGGDLHHHFSGSIYAEPLLSKAIEEDFYLNTTSFQVLKDKPNTGSWEKFSALADMGTLEFFKQKILEAWSVKDYNGVSVASDDLFFDSFDKFSPIINGNFEAGLTEIKQRALSENVSYIETQLNTIPNTIDLSQLNSYDAILREASRSNNDKKVLKTLEVIYNSLPQKEIRSAANDFNINFVAKLHKKLKIDDDQFIMRYQNFVLRFMDPVALFKNLVVAFESANSSDLIAGVNIVSPEHGEVSMSDYKLHMLMFQFCHTKFPKVKYTLHAGELTLGLVQPEDLTWHISSAIYDAGAHRIGHGVDVAHEKNVYDLLKYMNKNDIPVEINLTSNEFILKVKDNRHPILLYQEFDVPIVISSDDAGILRTNLTEQFVLLAKRYPSINYDLIKKYVYNSINYSFIKEISVKKQLLQDLDKRFTIFEKQFKQSKL